MLPLRILDLNSLKERLPLIDLHRHLDGNIRLSSILDFALQHGFPLPADNVTSLSNFVYIQDQTSDLLAFLKKVDIGVSMLGSIDNCRRVAYENVIDAISEGLDHVELRFSPYYMAKSHELPVGAVVEAVVDAVESANKEYQYNAKLIGILSRSFGVKACQKELEAILGVSSSSIVGLDLAGDEKNYPASMFTQHFTKARDAGLKITVHAGEADGPNSIWDAIHLLGATRIGHGVAAVEDVQLREYMALNQIGIESCILSNYQTGTWTNIASHPVKLFLEQGIPVCLNTDDPGVSNNTLESEYALAKDVVRLSEKQIQTLKLNALEQAFLSENEKNAIKSKFNGV